MIGLSYIAYPAGLYLPAEAKALPKGAIGSHTFVSIRQAFYSSYGGQQQMTGNQDTSSSKVVTWLSTGNCSAVAL